MNRWNQAGFIIAAVTLGFAFWQHDLAAGIGAGFLLGFGVRGLIWRVL